MSKREKMKDKIVAVVGKSGIAIRTEKIEVGVVLPDNMALADLLNELVAEGRLVRRFTLLNNGDTDQLYNIRMVS
ncbi:MAG: hypothetical protein JXA10_04255 [Anaerolineae bacterium]|nr:hypothetical protein [Anaerolineae bacterium]